MSGNELEAANRALEARVAKLESVTSSYRLAVARMEHLQRERRYRLLQAAATLLGDNIPPYDAELIRLCVDVAEALLAEIEKRETAEAQS